MKPVNVKLSKPLQSSFKFKKIRLQSLEFNWHFHPEYEIMFMVHSKGKRFIGDSISYYRSGDLFFMGPNLPHTWYALESAMGSGKYHEAILIQFMENFAGLNMREVPEFNAIHQLLTHVSMGVQFFGNCRKKAAEILLQMESQDGLERLLSLLSILDLLSKAEEYEREGLSSIEFDHRLLPKEQSRIDRVCSYINRNYKEQLRLKNVASIANMSNTAFSRFFKRSTGKTFINYVNELRIGWACKLLIESDMTIVKICFEVGFNNLSNFNRRFSERHNMSPREYRSEFSAKF